MDIRILLGRRDENCLSADKMVGLLNFISLTEFVQRPTIELPVRISLEMANLDIANFNEVELELLQQLQTQRLLKLQSYISCLEQKQKQLLRSQSIQPIQPSIKRQISLPVTNNATNLSDLCFPSLNTLTELSKSQTIIPPLPQAPCVALQRRDSSKSDGSQSPTDVSSSRYKTEMCRPFEETGQCRYGSKCQFAHGSHELRSLNRHPRYKTEYCRTFHTTGFCSYGQRCNFIHNEDERRPAQQQAVNRPQALNLNRHLPLTLKNSTGSTGSSPASSIYGDLSPTHSPSYLADDIFARRSPTPSYSSDSSYPSPPPGLPIPEVLFDNGNSLLTSSLDRLSLSLMNNLSF